MMLLQLCLLAINQMNKNECDTWQVTAGKASEAYEHSTIDRLSIYQWFDLCRYQELHKSGTVDQCMRDASRCSHQYSYLKDVFWHWWSIVACCCHGNHFIWYPRFWLGTNEECSCHISDQGPSCCADSFFTAVNSIRWGLFHTTDLYTRAMYSGVFCLLMTAFPTSQYICLRTHEVQI